MSIKSLPDSVVARLKSSFTITSLNQVACGLLKNSLDAGALNIHLFVDYNRGNCSVEDDGAGIPPAEFNENGGLGKLYRKEVAHQHTRSLGYLQKNTKKLVRYLQVSSK